MKILVLGASGMIGGTMFRLLADRTDWTVFGTLRGQAESAKLGGRLIAGIDLSNLDHINNLFRQVRPEIVVNCAGLTKHVIGGNEPIPALTMNALLPHRLVELCAVGNARLIHVSSDCVFSGRSGNYREDDVTDAQDIYGKTKALGEVIGNHVVTLRTSTIGHEAGTKLGLLEWFLSQRECKGFRKAIFSGLPTIEFARVVRDIVIPRPELSGLYNVGAEAIDKFSLLQLINNVYRAQVSILADDAFSIDRSLNVDRFTGATGYQAPTWPSLVDALHKDYLARRSVYV